MVWGCTVATSHSFYLFFPIHLCTERPHGLNEPFDETNVPVHQRF